MFKKAFTLSEVLVVVGIIGVVAVLTLPTVINSADRNKNITQLRKVQNELQAAFSQAITKYGDSEDWGAYGAQYPNRIFEFLDIKRCGITFPSTNYDSNIASYPKCELKDGTLITSTGNSILVALDGIDGNVSGESVFGFDIINNSGEIRPFGYESDRNASTNAFIIGNDMIFATNWAIANGNMDYLDCAASLNWETKLTCK